MEIEEATATVAPAMTKIAIATATLYKWKLYVICVRKSETDKKNSRSSRERELVRSFFICTAFVRHLCVRVNSFLLQSSP